MERDPVAERRKYVEAWNKTMIDIWEERIFFLKVKNTGNLYQSQELLQFDVDPEGRLVNLEISFGFAEYGLWQDLGVGRGVAKGNTHKRDGDGWTNPRERRRWYSTKYFSSVMNLRDFMADSLGQEFVGMFANLDADDLRRNTNYYRRKGWS